MNSVFSAFKTGKSSDNVCSKASKCNGNIGASNASNSSSSNSIKKNLSSSTSQDPTSYENLRHIREITMSNNFIGGGEGDRPKSSPTTPIIAVIPSVQSSTSLCMDFNECVLEDTVDSSTSSSSNSTLSNSVTELDHRQIIPFSAALPPSGKTINLNHEPNSEPNLLACASGNGKTQIATHGGGSDSGSDSEHNFINKIKARSEQLIGASSSRHNNKPRLSLSSASGVGFNNSMPSVHGRTTNTTNSSTTSSNSAPTRTRLSTHQRNLSLDFR